MSHWSLFVFSLLVKPVITSHREAVDVKGLDHVALSDGVTQGAVQTFVRVDGRHRGDGGSYSVRSLTQHRDVLLLWKLWGIVVLVHDMDIDGGRALQEKRG